MAVEIPITYEKIVKIWWAYSWRFLALGLVFSFTLGTLFAVVDQFLGISTHTLKIMTDVSAITVGILASQWVLRRLLVKGFGRYRLVLIEK